VDFYCVDPSFGPVVRVWYPVSVYLGEVCRLDLSIAYKLLPDSDLGANLGMFSLAVAAMRRKVPANHPH
jgi:hypothetical protein